MHPSAPKRPCVAPSSAGTREQDTRERLAKLYERRVTTVPWRS